MRDGLKVTVQDILNGHEPPSYFTFRQNVAITVPSDQERDSDSGQFTEEFSRQDFLEAVSSLDTATTKRVADEVECSYDLAYRRLKDLEGDGQVKSTRVGNSFVWDLGGN